MLRLLMSIQKFLIVLPLTLALPVDSSALHVPFPRATRARDPPPQRISFRLLPI